MMDAGEPKALRSDIALNLGADYLLRDEYGLNILEYAALNEHPLALEEGLNRLAEKIKASIHDSKNRHYLTAVKCQSAS